MMTKGGCCSLSSPSPHVPVGALVRLERRQRTVFRSCLPIYQPGPPWPKDGKSGSPSSTPRSKLFP